MKFINLHCCMMLTLLLASAMAKAQTCPDFPIDCADDETNQQLAEKKWQGAEDYKVKEEYVMQDNLRQFFKGMMEQMSKATKWRMFQYDEFQESGIAKAENIPLAYPYRRPCTWEISFIFVVNEDSLHAWQHWYNNDLQAKSNSLVDAYKQNVPGENVSKMINDSIDYYSNRKAKYMEANFPDYQKALVANDQKGIKKYESGLKKYDDDIDALTKRIGAKASPNHASLEHQGDDLQTYRHNNFMLFRNSCMLRVSFKVNDHTSPSYDEAHAKDLVVPGATISKMMHNTKTEDNEVFGSYTRAPDFAIAFFGKWVTKLNEYNSYNAVYRSDPKNTDAVTIKKIPCDKVQTVQVHVEGSPKYITQFLKLLDTQKINSLIVKQ